LNPINNLLPFSNSNATIDLSDVSWLSSSMKQFVYIVSSIIIMLLFPIISTVSAQTPTTTCPTLPTNTGMVTASITIPSTLTYTIWSRMKATDTTNNSYYLQIDNSCGIKVGDSTLLTNNWTWINYQNGNTSSLIKVSLTSGTHVIKLIGSEPGVGIDRLLFLSDTTCIPTGTGDSCLASTTPTQPLTPPATTIMFSPTTATSPTATITPTSTPTPIPSLSPTPTLSPTTLPVASPTAVKLKGDYNSNGAVEELVLEYALE
jgi:hypothetical protein